MASIVALWLLALGEGDHRTGLLPTRRLWPGIAAVTVIGLQDPVAWSSALLAAVPYLLAFVLGQVGGGDVKLAFVVGGLLADPVSVVVAICGAQVVGLAGLAVSRRRAAPHGPALTAVAAVLVIGG